MAGPDLSSGRVPLDRSAAEYTPEIDNIDRGYIHTWNVAFERRLPYDVSVDVAYVGAKGVGGYAGLDINAPLTLGGGDASRPYLRMGRIQPIWSWGARLPTKYQSLQVALNKPFTKGFMFKGAYTLSKAMNYGTDADGRATLSWNTPSELWRNWSPAGFDRRHNFQMGFAWALPGQSVDGSYNSIGHAIFGDWQLNGVIAAFTGSPFTMTASGTVLNTPSNTQTADQVGDYNILGNIGNAGKWFDTASFVNPTGVRFGNTGRNQFYGPGAWTTDLSIFRSFALGGQRRLEARVQGNNIFNHPVFGNPNATHDGRYVRTDHRLRAGWRVLHRAAVPGRRPLHVLTSDPRRACERGGDSPRAPFVRRPMPAPGSILLLAILAAVSPAQSTLPPVPRLALETFPAAARDAVSKQYKEAAARPADAGAMGALGRILHAWEQWDSAHQAYERAAALAPSDFDWTYLDAIVLQRLARYDAAASALRRALAARAGLPAGQAQARGSAARGRRPRAERTAVRPADGDRRDGAGGGSGTGPHQRGAGPALRRPFATSSGRSRCFRSLAPHTTRWREPTARPAAPPTPSAPPRRTPATARAGRDSTIPCWPPSPRCVRTHGPPWPGA